jgi:hypothetical protein
MRLTWQASHFNFEFEPASCCMGVGTGVNRIYVESMRRPPRDVRHQILPQRLSTLLRHCSSQALCFRMQCCLAQRKARGWFRWCLHPPHACQADNA